MYGKITFYYNVPVEITDATTIHALNNDSFCVEKFSY